MMQTDEVLVVHQVHKRFDGVTALDGFTLSVRRGVLLSLLGPSGCGKTTALRVIAGFERPEAGTVSVGGRPVAGDGTWVPPERRRIGMVFQDWALFPHLDVWRNVAFGMPNGSDERVREVLRLVRLEGLEERHPHELSGGQQQRVALARAMAPAPEVILLDEPFSNLDATLRAGVRAEVRQVLGDIGATAVFVTHDQEEALSIADEVAVMDEGRVLQTGTPHEVYAEPADPRVARLLGDANLLEGEAHDGRVATVLGDVAAPGAGGDVQVLVRPEAVAVEPDPASSARVEAIDFYGHDQRVRVRLADGSLIDARPFGARPDLAPGTAVRLRLAGAARVFPRVVGHP